MATRRNALGRGLGALIPSSESAAPSVPLEAAAPAASDRAPSELPVDDIAPNPDQPRRVFDETELTRLASSIRRHGILQPVVVREAPPGRAKPYELLVGERRWRACQLAGHKTIPVTIQDVAPADRLEIALIENVQRQDLNPIELAQALRALADAGLTQQEVGDRVGFDRSSVANLLRLLELPRELQQDVEQGALSTGHAKALLALANPERRRHLRDRIVAEGLSVRAAEELARSLGSPKTRRVRARASDGAVDPNLQQLIDSLRDRLQTKVRITGEAARGKIEVEFFGPEDLHRISQAILEERGGL